MPGIIQSSHHATKTVISVAALLSSLVLLSYAVRWTAAEVLTARAVSKLYNMDQLSDRNLGMDLLARAKTLNPYNARLPLYQAQFLRRDLKIAHDQSRPALIKISPIYEHYRQALAIHPHSGHLWAQYARAQFENSNDIQGTLSTLEKAIKFAPYQTAVIITAIQIGLPNWTHLNDSQKLRLRQLIDFLLGKNAALVINIAVTDNLAEQLRPLLKQDKHLKRLDQALIKK